MSKKAREYKRSTIRRLDTLSGNVCAAPNCKRKLIARDGDTIVSKICHIEAASSEGPRYNPAMSDDERRHFNNLILLCDECHSIIDNRENEHEYPKELLYKWKEDHESILRYSYLTEKPSLLNQAINGISSIILEDDVSVNIDSLSSFSIEDKIMYNELKRNKSLIEEYAKFFPKINTLYGVLEEEGSFKKEKLLRNIKLLYIRAKGKYISETGGKVSDYSDDIFEDIEEELLASTDTIYSANEDISFAIPIIMVDAFMRCKILEKPNGV